VLVLVLALPYCTRVILTPDVESRHLVYLRFLKGDDSGIIGGIELRVRRAARLISRLPYSNDVQTLLLCRHSKI
jgi:hypothetical protein